MVGQGVLRECLVDPHIERVLAVVRTTTETRHQKLRELVLLDFLDYTPVESELAGYDTCFFCLGVTSAGLSDLRMPFKASYVFRPAYIQPQHGIRSRTRMYRILYVAVAPLYPLLKAIFPRHVSTTGQIGRAMIAVARQGASKRLLESADINEVAVASAGAG